MRRLPGYHFMGSKPGFMAFDRSPKCDDPQGTQALGQWESSPPAPPLLAASSSAPCFPLPLSWGSLQEGALDIEEGGGGAVKGRVSN